MARGALVAGGLALPLAAGAAGLLRGGRGAASATIALAIVIANFAVAAAVSALAARRSSIAAAFVGLPSYAVRMAVIFSGLGLLHGRPFIDSPTFAATFAAGIVAILTYECVLWARTPWLATTMEERA